jgi:hypothetical protein
MRGGKSKKGKKMGKECEEAKGFREKGRKEKRKERREKKRDSEDKAVHLSLSPSCS